MRKETGPLSLSLGQGFPVHVHRLFHINMRMFFLSELVITVDLGSADVLKIGGFLLQGSTAHPAQAGA